jgi:hypothetical protein
MMSVRLRIVRSISLVLLTLALVLALIANNIPDDRRQTAPRIKPSTSSSTQSLIPYSKVPGNKCFAIFLIYSAPQYRNRREAVRNSWLEWLDPNQQHCYRFITHTKRNATSVKSNENDLTVLDGPDGRLQYGKRGLDLLRFGEQHFTSGYSYLVKLDDDGFLCLPRLLYQLKRRPRQRFVWGKYWLQNQWGRNRGRTRMDENFMVISRDLVQFIVLNTGSSDSLLAFDPTQTFAVNFAYWTHFLRLNIHDDRSEIDSQQHYLTSYMVCFN